MLKIKNNSASQTQKTEGNDIIDGRQKKTKRYFEIILSVIGWLYIVVYVVYIIYGMVAKLFGLPVIKIGIYNDYMITETMSYFKILSIIILISIVIITFWRFYNAKRYGEMKRRFSPQNSNNKELSEYFNIDESVIVRMQTEKIITLENNIV